MRFGIFLTVRWHQEWTQEQSLLEALERIELADQVGLDVWLGEHHFSRHGLLSGLFSFAGAAIARTKRARIGMAVVVLPFHNPIRVAEEAAMMDVLSGGRLDLGVGSGYQRQEFEGLGVDLEESRERFRESLDVIVKAWTEEELTFSGKYTDVEGVAVVPKPIQVPHPPLFIAVSTSPETVEYAASRAIPVMVGGPTAALGKAPEVIGLWRRKMEEFGHEHAHVDPPVNMNIHVAPTVEEAERDAAGREDFSTRILAKIGSPVDKDGRLPTGYEAWANRQKDRELASVPGRAGSMALRGSPDVVVERLKEVQELGIEHVFGYFGYPGLSHKKRMQSIELFASEVMPHLREPVKQPAQR